MFVAKYQDRFKTPVHPRMGARLRATSQAGDLIGYDGECPANRWRYSR